MNTIDRESSGSVPPDPEKAPESQPVVPAVADTPGGSWWLGVVPGLGHFALGRHLRATAVLLGCAILAWVAVADHRMVLLALAAYFCQLLDARRLTISRPPASAATPNWVGWAIIAFGVVMLAQNLFGGVLGRLPELLPVFLIVLGARLVWTYFRAPTEPAS